MEMAGEGVPHPHRRPTVHPTTAANQPLLTRQRGVGVEGGALVRVLAVPQALRDTRRANRHMRGV